MSPRNLRDTDTKASLGHSWNQSVLVVLMRAGNLRLLLRRVLPCGEKHNTTLKERNDERMNERERKWKEKKFN